MDTNLFKLSAIGFSILTSFHAYADCRTVISEMAGIANQPGYFMNAHVSSSKAGPDRHHASHAYGFFDTTNSPSVLSGQFKTAFSDRGYFNVSRTDVQDIYLNTSGTGEVILRTWGNTRLPLREMNCTKDAYGYYISGKTLEGNGTTLYAIALKSGYLG